MEYYLDTEQNVAFSQNTGEFIKHFLLMNLQKKKVLKWV